MLYCHVLSNRYNIYGTCFIKRQLAGNMCLKFYIVLSIDAIFLMVIWIKLHLPVGKKNNFAPMRTELLPLVQN